jgi:pimeloyl-ACP methyl ester carboxylesterase
LLHELGGCSESWRAVTPILATDRRVIAVDFRSAGRSEKPIGSFELSDIADVLRLCCKRWASPIPWT